MRRFLILGHSAPIEPDFHLNDLPGGAGRLDVLCRAVGASLLVSHGIRQDVETILLLRDTVRIRIDGHRVKRLNPDERSTAALIRKALSVLADTADSAAGSAIRSSEGSEAVPAQPGEGAIATSQTGAFGEGSEGSGVFDPADPAQPGEGAIADPGAFSAVSSLPRNEETQSSPGIHVSRCTLETALDDLLAAGASPIVLHENGTPVDSFAFPSDPAFILSDHTDYTEEDERLLADLPRVSFGPRPVHTSQAITIAHYLLDRREQDVNEDLALAHKVWGEPQAQMIKGLLEDFGIPANLVTHATPSVYPMVLDGLAEVRIMVRSRDLEQARQVIADYFEAPCEE
jgi:tRNA (pseudouridine54-N1)-methyltransferase